MQNHEDLTITYIRYKSPIFDQRRKKKEEQDGKVLVKLLLTRAKNEIDFKKVSQIKIVLQIQYAETRVEQIFSLEKRP